MMDFDQDIFVDFTKCSISSNNFNLNDNIQLINYAFDKTTTETYRVMRELKLDPIDHDKVSLNLQFKFEYMWDPITGDRLGKDPYGPFYFNVFSLAKNFYYNRLRMLWVEGDIIDGIKYEGYYGDGMKSGEDLYVPSRGISKHMHLFRLPIIDCYLPKDFNYSIITMGPKLTDDEINQIQGTLNNYYKTHNKKNKINLCKIRDLYNIAINTNSTDEEAKKAIEELKKMPKIV